MSTKRYGTIDDLIEEKLLHKVHRNEIVKTLGLVRPTQKLPKQPEGARMQIQSYMMQEGNLIFDWNGTLMEFASLADDTKLAFEKAIRGLFEKYRDCTMFVLEHEKGKSKTAYLGIMLSGENLRFLIPTHKLNLPDLNEEPPKTK